MSVQFDNRIVLTLDAGGTNFVFSAIRANEIIGEVVALPAETKNLERSLATIKRGFELLKEQLSEDPVAISFAFPGPADYANGIIENLGNLPAFAGGVPLGPWLEKEFGIPVFINNDGDLFVYGEAIAGVLPKVNNLLEQTNNPKRYKNLFGVTLGTGFGAGLVTDGKLFTGDNSNGLEIWLMRNKVYPDSIAEIGASIRAVQNCYSKLIGISAADSPSPKEIGDIARGDLDGNQEAAIESYRELGETIGDAIANSITLMDGLVVIGGGLSQSHDLFMPAVMKELKSQIKGYGDSHFDRIVQKSYNLEDPDEVVEFVEGNVKELVIPGTTETIQYDSSKRIGIACSVLGTSMAVGIGAYAYALHTLDNDYKDNSKVIRGKLVHRYSKK